MRKIAIINQKGGVGKTTTAINLAAGLGKRGARVLILDLDGQGNIATSFHIKANKDMYSVLIEKEKPESCIIKLNDNLGIITSNDTLEKAEIILAGQPARETILRRAMDSLQGYDYVLLDCPPSLGLLNQNAILYAKEAFIPVSTDYLGFDALKKIVNEIETINNIFNHSCQVRMIIPTMYDGRNRTCKEHLARIRDEFAGTPIADPIRINSKLKEMPFKGRSIFETARTSHGASDYDALVEKVFRQKAV